jgi:hypothetical protein
VGVGGGGEVEEGGGERSGALVFEERDDAVALGEDGFGALEVVFVVEGDGELFEHALQAAARAEVEAVAVGLAGGLVAVVLLDVLEIEAGGEGGDGVVEEGPLAEDVKLGFLEARVVDPELLAVADGDAGTRAFDFAPEFVGGLEGDRALADERFGEQMGVLFLDEIRGEGRELLTVLLEGFHQGLCFRGGKLGGARREDGCEAQDEGEAVSQDGIEGVAHFGRGVSGRGWRGVRIGREERRRGKRNVE